MNLMKDIREALDLEEMMYYVTFKPRGSTLTFNAQGMYYDLYLPMYGTVITFTCTHYGECADVSIHRGTEHIILTADEEDMLYEVFESLDTEGALHETNYA